MSTSKGGHKCRDLIYRPAGALKSLSVAVDAHSLGFRSGDALFALLQYTLRQILLRAEAADATYASLLLPARSAAAAALSKIRVLLINHTDVHCCWCKPDFLSQDSRRMEKQVSRVLCTLVLRPVNFRIFQIFPTKEMDVGPERDAQNDRWVVASRCLSCARLLTQNNV